MEFDFAERPEKDRYRLLCAFVGPRPIALVTTIDEQGCKNAAPMSFFNVFSHDPPLLILGMQTRPDGNSKDTVANIRRSGEFVVHMVDMAIAKEMIITGINFPSDVDEIQVSGLTSVSSVKVAPPRIQESPCAMECRVSQILNYGRRSIVIGEVLQMYVRDECLDASGRYVLPDVYQPIARLHANNYIVADNQFVLTKPDEFAHHDNAAGYGGPVHEAKGGSTIRIASAADGQKLDETVEQP
ncbi:flavin reductase family protein [Sinorhizobium meliloti]|uniref:flavin reductase family protein n=1 Tax=Rhizobium meliloti TaxID=382 RepID=UPI000FD8C3C8|nr:flavin reductase family protein [Sinorhizobium meliloti]MCM5689528.1 flavin reductase family protein [Sinorhizobium meliloti]RVG35280.1 flavin reductase family protein [Sinorhizobium meliloti]RVL02226.1 flavin reductase family protein [Sinorhizobium meliloti]RVN48612.1 flavin reductase family protein [Sinorhizobium meliloti]